VKSVAQNAVPIAVKTAPFAVKIALTAVKLAIAQIAVQTAVQTAVLIAVTAVAIASLQSSNCLWSSLRRQRPKTKRKMLQLTNAPAVLAMLGFHGLTLRTLS
jgi:hypothetical protein